MAINTYALLKTSIANHLHRTDLTDLIPDFISYAEGVTGGDPEPSSMDALPGIRTKNQVKRVTTTLSSQYLDIPTDLLAIEDMQINNNPIVPLEFMSAKQLTQKYPSSPVGTPKAFCMHGDEFQFSHDPNTSLELEISYIGRYAAFNDDADTNWLLTNNPFAYVYAAMIAASNYTDEDPSKYAALYKSIASGINDAEKAGQLGSQLTARSLYATP